jgi:hypothetical protein
MIQDTLAAENAACLRAVANALATDHGVIGFLQQLAPQWGSTTGKTRSYGGLNRPGSPGPRCVLRVDSRAAILLNDALYRPRGPSRLASRLAAALRNPQIDEGGARCRVEAEDRYAIEIRIQQYSDEAGNEVAPESPLLHHRVVSVLPA